MVVIDYTAFSPAHAKLNNFSLYSMPPRQRHRVMAASIRDVHVWSQFFIKIVKNI